MPQDTLLLTGATSQIGFFLLPLLLEQQEVVVISRQPAELQHPKLQWLQADLNDATLSHLDCDWAAISSLFHIAPLSLLPNLLKHLPQVQRLIAFSSTSRFSKADSDNAQEQALAARLQAGEAQLETLCQARQIAWTLFRPTLIYGCGRDKNVFFIAQQIQRFGFFPLAGDGRGLRQPVHAQDLAQACVLAWQQPRCFNRAYNLSGGQTLSYADMVRQIFRSMGRTPRLLKIPPWLLRLVVFLLRALPPFRKVSLSMIDRMNRDLCFEHVQAQADFGYQARVFKPDKQALRLG